MKKTIAVIDGMGGGIGSELVTQLRKEFSDKITIIALGTNAVATDRMVQSKANRGASGENAIKISVKKADFIMGPIGIILPNALMGEITPKIAKVIMNSRGVKILLPINQPHIKIMGINQEPLGNLIKMAIEEIKSSI